MRTSLPALGPSRRRRPSSTGSGAIRVVSPAETQASRSDIASGFATHVHAGAVARGVLAIVDCSPTVEAGVVLVGVGAVKR